jgi:hypothetical protein
VKYRRFLERLIAYQNNDRLKENRIQRFAFNGGSLRGVVLNLGFETKRILSLNEVLS